MEGGGGGGGGGEEVSTKIVAPTDLQKAHNHNTFKDNFQRNWPHQLTVFMCYIWNFITFSFLKLFANMKQKNIFC